MPSPLAGASHVPAPGAPSSFFRIQGGNRLAGRVRISGAKNGAVALMAAALLTDEEVVVEDVPLIGDVAIMAQVLRSLGTEVAWDQQARLLRLRAANIHTFTAPDELVDLNRASFLVMGPLLARFGRAASASPGGDVIGQRPVDVHLSGFAALGAQISRRGPLYQAQAEQLRGSRLFMDYPSHMGTENILMASTLAEGDTVIRNASQEPEVVALAQMLNAMGADVSGAGGSTIRVRGVDQLAGTRQRLIPDRIEAGTFAIAAALTDGDVELENVRCDHIDSLLWKLQEVGAEVIGDDDCLTVRCREPLRATNVQALPYPGFATDLQAVFGVLLTQAGGRSVIHERVYDNRLRYFRELRKMGAQVTVRGQTAEVYGPTPLHGARVRGLDVRAGAALVLAALVARGTSEVHDIYHLDRGYEGFERKLGGLGAAITRPGPTAH